MVADDVILDDGELYLGTPLGTLNFLKLNKNDVVSWLGNTHNGPDYWGQAGIYEFRIVVVDQGGNVSAKRFYKKQDLGWSDFDTKPDRWSDLEE